MLQTILPVIGNVIDKLIPDNNKRQEAKEEMEKALIQNANAINLAQIEVNKADAQSANWFQSSWRPLCGWTCGFALAWHFVISPMLIFFTAWFGFDVPKLPVFDMESLMTVLFGLLGMSGLRSWEKSRGIAK